MLADGARRNLANLAMGVRQTVLYCIVNFGYNME